MKNYKILVTAILLCFNISYSQSGWVWQNPTPGIGPVNYSTFFVNENTGWVSSGNSISISTNGGDSWTKQFESSVYAIYSLNFLNTQTGYACGPYGRFFSTTNGGTDWQTKIVGDTTNFFSCVYFRDTQTGFLGDYRNRNFYRTTNAGVNWIRSSIALTGVGIPVYMNFFNENEGMIVTSSTFFGSSGGNSTSYKTTNGGINWAALSNPPGSNSYFLRNGFFLNMQIGWLCGQDTIFKTTNSGVNWSRSPAKGFNYQVKFINPSTGYSCADSGRIYKTVDAGQTWSLQNNEFSNNLYNLSAVGNLCAAVGALSTIVRSSDGGISWAVSPHSFLFSDMIAIKAFNISDIVGISYYDFVTSYNGGATWEVYDIPFTPTTSMYFLNSQTGWVIVSGGGIMRTTDRGLTWNNRSIQMAGPVNNVFFINSETGWATTDNGIYKTQNSGLYWTNYVDPNFFLDYDEVIFVNELTGWTAVSSGANLSVVKTTNGGLNWVNQTTFEWNIVAMHFLNSQTGWIATNTNFRRTTNGGTTWDSISEVNDITDMQFINSLTGWAAAGPLPSQASGKVYNTTNGGVTWLTQYSAPYNNFRAVSFINNNIGWAVGSSGCILKTTTGGNVFISQISTEIPEKYSLYQNYPNPFNPSTNIKFDIHKQGIASLKVFDLLGKEMETLVDEQLSVGTYEVTFNASSLPSGIYFYVLKTGDFVESKKMVLVK